MTRSHDLLREPRVTFAGIYAGQLYSNKAGSFARLTVLTLSLSPHVFRTQLELQRRYSDLAEHILGFFGEVLYASNPTRITAGEAYALVAAQDDPGDRRGR